MAIVRITNLFGTYELRNPRTIQSGFGPCLAGDYRKLGEKTWQGEGHFRCDRLIEREVVSGQMELEAA